LTAVQAPPVHWLLSLYELLCSGFFLDAANESLGAAAKVASAIVATRSADFLNMIFSPTLLVARFSAEQLSLHNRNLFVK
jgi:hypothetical protein